MLQLGESVEGFRRGLVELDGTMDMKEECHNVAERVVNINLCLGAKDLDDCTIHNEYALIEATLDLLAVVTKERHLEQIWHSQASNSASWRCSFSRLL